MQTVNCEHWNAPAGSRVGTCTRSDRPKTATGQEIAPRPGISTCIRLCADRKAMYPELPALIEVTVRGAKPSALHQIAAGVAGTARSIFVRARQETINLRLSICGECEHNVNRLGLRVCDECGCVIASKVRDRRAMCPLGRWRA